MRQKLDFSLLVVTSFIVVLALEPVHQSLNKSAAASEPSSPKPRAADSTDAGNARNSSGNPLLIGSAERILRDLERNKLDFDRA